MTKSTGSIVRFRPASSRKFDLALALARLGKGVRAHEDAVRRAQVLFLRRLALRVIVGRG